MASRRLALLTLLLVLIPACNLQRAGTQPVEQAAGTADYGSGVDLSDVPETPAADQAAEPRATLVAKANSGAAPARTTRPPSTAKSGAAFTGIDRLLQDFGGTGTNNKLYLRPDVPKLVVEIGAVIGREPTQESLDHLRGVLESVVDKPGGIEFRITSVFEAQAQEYSTEQMMAIEEDHRRTWSTEKSATLYMLFLNGGMRGAPSVLGVAWRGSSVAMFTDKIRSSVSGLIPFTTIEKAVIVHEVGHLLSLVNLGYKSPRPHEDPNHPGHSRNRESVMYWAVESDVVSQVFTGPPPDNFDGDDRADLRDIREGRLD